MTADLAALERVLARTALRMRVQRGLDWAARAVAALSLGGGCLAVVSRDGVPDHALVYVAGAGAAVLLLSLLRPIARERVGERIDRACALDGRIRAAVGFLREPSEDRAPFVRAALRDAEHHAGPLEARHVVSLRRPQHAWLAALTALGLLLLPGRPPAQPTWLPGAPDEPRVVLLDRDELRGLERELSAARSAPPVELQRRLAEYAALLQRIELGDTAPAELIARALALEAALRAGADVALTTEDRAALAQLASELRPGSPALARALADDLPEAARQLRDLSERLQKKALTPREQRQLAEALDQARERERQRISALQREEQLTSLLKQKEQAASGSDEPRLLKRRQEQKRELELLRRKRERPLQRELQKLSRELSETGDALSQQQPERAGEAAKRAAEALDRLEQAQDQAQRTRALTHAVSQLRELLQRRALSQTSQTRRETEERDKSSESARSAAARRQRFSERARGQDADAGSGRERGAAEGDEHAEARTMVALPSSTEERVETIEVRSDGAGTEHDSARGGASARPRADYQDLRLHGMSGAGPTRSQVIRTAAGSGFAAARYRKVYGDYREHAEAVLERDQVPAGYRFHVRRYFELVRPREGQDSHD